jgi:hypothetical protein
MYLWHIFFEPHHSCLNRAQDQVKKLFADRNQFRAPPKQVSNSYVRALKSPQVRRPDATVRPEKDPSPKQQKHKTHLLLSTAAQNNTSPCWEALWG